MTPDQLRDRERHSALMAVAHALTADERERFLDRTSRWPDMDGADVADVLDLTVEHDEFLAWTEPFYERHAGELPDTPGVIFALHALIILDPRPFTAADRGPSLGAVCALLVKAGIADGCPDGGTCHHECAVACFRVLCCGPLSGRFPGDRWPDVLAEEHRAAVPAYDPTHDLAVFLAADFGGVRVSGADYRNACARLQAHIATGSVEEAETSLRVLRGEDA